MSVKKRKPRDCRGRLYYCHTSVETKHGFTSGTTLSLHLCRNVVTEYINNYRYVTINYQIQNIIYT